MVLRLYLTTKTTIFLELFKIKGCKDKETATKLALELAVAGYANMLACKELIASIAETDESK